MRGHNNYFFASQIRINYSSCLLSGHCFLIGIANVEPSWLNCILKKTRSTRGAKDKEMWDLWISMMHRNQLSARYRSLMQSQPCFVQLLRPSAKGGPSAALTWFSFFSAGVQAFGKRSLPWVQWHTQCATPTRRASLLNNWCHRCISMYRDSSPMLPWHSL